MADGTPFPDFIVKYFSTGTNFHAGDRKMFFGVEFFLNIWKGHLMGAKREGFFRYPTP
jgi:hypothetical protein